MDVDYEILAYIPASIYLIDGRGRPLFTRRATIISAPSSYQGVFIRSRGTSYRPPLEFLFWATLNGHIYRTSEGLVPMKFHGLNLRTWFPQCSFKKRLYLWEEGRLNGTVDRIRSMSYV